MAISSSVLARHQKRSVSYRNRASYLVVQFCSGLREGRNDRKSAFKFNETKKLCVICRPARILGEFMSFRRMRIWQKRQEEAYALTQAMPTRCEAWQLLKRSVVSGCKATFSVFERSIIYIAIENDAVIQISAVMGSGESVLPWRRISMVLSVGYRRRRQNAVSAGVNTCDVKVYRDVCAFLLLYFRRV